MGAGDSEDEKAPLSEIIERFDTDFTEGEPLFLRQVQEDAIREQGVREMALANPFEKFSLGIREQLIRLMMGRMAENDALVTRCLNDPDFPLGARTSPADTRLPGYRKPVQSTLRVLG